MKIKTKKMARDVSLLAAAALFGLGACGEPVDGGADGGEQTPAAEATPDGEGKSVDGRADAWNWRNDPRHFRHELDYTFEGLPGEGRLDITPWTGSYWPYVGDGINARWQADRGMSAQDSWRGLSPAEKYDIAFNGWIPPEGFQELSPMDAHTCEFDEAYYQALGPAADWTHRNKGLGRLTNGIDDDRDGTMDADECAEHSEGPSSTSRRELDGLETWWGICHAWAPAALMEQQPLGPVTRNGVTFDTADLKGLIMQQWDRTRAYGVGGRCEEAEIERDDTGRVLTDECRDLNAGSWHVIVTNFIGMNKKGFVIERTTNYEVWNQPLFGYKITEQREITLDEAHQLLNVDDSDIGNGTEVLGLEEESHDALAVLELVNTANLEQLREAGLSDDLISQVLAHRDGADAEAGTGDDDTFDELAELASIESMNEQWLGMLLDFALAEGLSRQEYRYNPEAARFVEVRMTTDWITEQHQSAERSDLTIDRWTKHDHYHYILELDADGEVLGGEWVGSSNLNHPDFVWLPVRAVSGNPNLDIETIRELIQESRREVLGEEEMEPQVQTYTVDEPVVIPDADADGVTSTISVDAPGSVQKLTLDMTIDHTYRGDLVVELRHGGISFTVFDGREVDQPWKDDVSFTGLEMEGFKGNAAEGDWELVVYDTYRWDVGEVTDWSLTFETVQ